VFLCHRRFSHVLIIVVRKGYVGEMTSDGMMYVPNLLLHISYYVVCCKDMNCIDVVQDINQWPSLVNTVMDLWVP
jgi:hypothetical protein